MAMNMTRAAIAATMFGAMLAAAGACAEVDRPGCYAGDFVACACASGARGYATCAGNGTYAACVCDGHTPGTDGSADDAEAGADAPPAKQGFMAVCAKNDECESGICKDFPSRGTFCTRACTTATAATDCPAPSPGCNKDGVCKAP